MVYAISDVVWWSLCTTWKCRLAMDTTWYGSMGLVEMDRFHSFSMAMQYSTNARLNTARNCCVESDACVVAMNISGVTGAERLTPMTMVKCVVFYRVLVSSLPQCTQRAFVACLFLALERVGVYT